MIIEIVCDGNLNNIFYILKTILDIIMIIAPILALVSLSMTIFDSVINPDNKKNLPKFKNTIIALMIIFFIPVLINLVTLIIGEKTDITSCWNKASRGNINIKYYDKEEKSSDKTKVYTDTKSYHGKTNAPSISSNYLCPNTIRRTRTVYNNNALKVDTSFYLEAHNYEFGNHYITQSGVYDCKHIIVGQNKQYKVNGVTYKSSGRIVWYDIKTGQRTAIIDIGNEGGHLDRLAYDSDRNIVLLHLRNDKMLQIDNKTHKIIEEQKYTMMTGGDSKFIKYDSYNHQLIGLSGNIISYYKYNQVNNTYVKISSISLKATSKWAPQNFNTDGQVIYIANSHPNWSVDDYAVIVYDMKTGRMLEYHKLDHVPAGHLEDVIIDTDGNLWLICPDKYMKTINYAANSYSIGP